MAIRATTVQPPQSRMAHRLNSFGLAKVWAVAAALVQLAVLQARAEPMVSASTEAQAPQASLQALRAPEALASALAAVAVVAVLRTLLPSALAVRVALAGSQAVNPQAALLVVIRLLPGPSTSAQVAAEAVAGMVPRATGRLAATALWAVAVAAVAAIPRRPEAITRVDWEATVEQA